VGGGKDNPKKETVRDRSLLYRPLPSSYLHKFVSQPRASLYPTRSGAGALLGEQLTSRGYQTSILLGVTPEGVEIAAHASKAMGAQWDVLVASFIKLAANQAPIGAMAETVPAEMDPDFMPGMNLLEKLQAAIDDSRSRVKQDLVVYRTQRPLKNLEGRTAVIVDAQIVYPWKVLAAAKAAEQLRAKEVVIATPVAAQPAAERIRARQYAFVCPSVVMEPEGHPSPYGDPAADTERVKSIMIAHQAA
jgi:putative phosphoribosyl transferase